MIKMTLALASILMPFTLAASTNNMTTTCKLFRIGPWHNQSNVQISFDGDFKVGDILPTRIKAIQSNEEASLEHKNLKVEVMRKVIIDDFKEPYFAMGIVGTTYNQTYGIRVHITSSDPVATKVYGCTPTPVHETFDHLICNVSQSQERI